MLASAGAAGYSSWWAKAAHAEEAPKKTKVPTECNGCSNKCGIWVHTENGVISTVEGMKEHPYSKGTVCARGHGFAQFVYSDERLTQPMKRMDDGEYEPISWDQAIAEIGEKMKSIIDDDPMKLALIHDPRPNGKYYGSRFMQAIGSSNVYTHNAACNTSQIAGFRDVVGGRFSADVGNAKAIMFIGRSYADGIRPSAVNNLANLALKGEAKIIMVDPRYNNSCPFATQWVPIVPGTDLALVLGMSNVLVAEELYDKEFVEKYTMGFEDYAKGLEQFTPEWASKKCGVEAEVIKQLAHDLAAAAPAAVIEPSWRAAFGCSYVNSYECARAVAAFNALLGSWGQKGGALITGSPKLGSLDETKFPKVPKVTAKRVGDKEYPLTPSGNGPTPAVVEAALDGRLRGVIFYQSNGAKGYADPKKWKEALAKLDLVVSIEVQMSETALLSDYVLPECTSFERDEVPTLLGGKGWAVVTRVKAVEKVHPETKTGDEIFRLFAQAVGVEKYFPFTNAELIEAQLASIDVTMDQLMESGTVKLEGSTFEYGKVPKFKTDSGKLQFRYDALADVDRKPVITWIDRAVYPKEGEFFFVGGKQSIHAHTMSSNIPSLMDVSKKYHLERLWISAEDAAALGVKEGDTVEVSNEEHTARVAAHVTERLRPGVVYTPTHYGGTSPYLSHSFEYGIGMPEFVPFRIEPGVGSSITQEVAVSVKKVSA